MPSNPTAAQSEASRRNGACSRGPVTAEGKVRSARTDTRHGLFATELELTPEEQAHFAALLEDLGRRHRPVGAAEQHWVRQVAVTMLRRGRLDALEMRVLDLALEGAYSVHDAGLPSPASWWRSRASWRGSPGRCCGARPRSRPATACLPANGTAVRKRSRRRPTMFAGRI